MRPQDKWGAPGLIRLAPTLSTSNELTLTRDRLIYYPAGSADNKHRELGSVWSFFKLPAHEWHPYPRTHYRRQPRRNTKRLRVQLFLRGSDEESDRGHPERTAVHARGQAHIARGRGRGCRSGQGALGPKPQCQLGQVVTRFQKPMAGALAQVPPHS